MSKAELRKAAVLLMTLPAEQADRLLARLTPEEVAAVTAEMARVESLSAAEQEAVILAFAEAEPSPPLAAPHAPDSYSRQDDRPASADRPFSYASQLNCQSLADALADERPQTIALVASHVPASLGAEMVGSLEPSLQLAVIRAVAAMEPTDPAIVAEVSDVLSQRLGALAR